MVLKHVNISSNLIVLHEKLGPDEALTRVWESMPGAEPEPFGLAEVNRKLAALGREVE
jgi:hypothetical protein